MAGKFCFNAGSAVYLVRIRILVERTINGWFLEWRVVRYSDLFVYRVYVRWTVVDDQR